MVHENRTRSGERTFLTEVLPDLRCGVRVKIAGATLKKEKHYDTRKNLRNMEH